MLSVFGREQQLSQIQFYDSDASAWLPSYHHTETTLIKLTDWSASILLDLSTAQLTTLFLKYSISQDTTLS